MDPPPALRGALNLSNVALVQVDADGSFAGPAAALAARIGHQLGRPVVLTGYSDAAAIVAASAMGAWDVAFIAVDPSRLDRIAYSDPYARVQICYAVPESSVLREEAEVDRAGIRIASTRTAAYDLLLRRILKHAELLSFDSGAQSFAGFAAGEADCLAGLREALSRFIAGNPGFRLLPGTAATIDQAVAVPLGGEALLPAINAAIAVGG